MSTPVDDAGAGRVSPRPRGQVLRLGAAVTVGAVLVLGLGAVPGIGPGAGERPSSGADPAVSSGSPAGVDAYVRESVLVCPGSAVHGPAEDSAGAAGTADPASDPAAVTADPTNDPAAAVTAAADGPEGSEVVAGAQEQAPHVQVAAALAPNRVFADDAQGRESGGVLSLESATETREGRANGLTGGSGEPGDAAGHLRVETPGPVVVTGSGGGAPGVSGGQLTLTTAAGGRGLSLTPCTLPAATVHLAGGGPGAGRTESLVLTNPADDPVTVDVEVLDVDGPADVTGGRGLVVEPGSQLVGELDALAPAARAPVVRVTAAGGTIGAHLTDLQRDGTTDLGFDVVPALAEPARELVVPALPDAGGGVTTLRLLAADESAVVELRSLTPQGGVVPDPGVVRVPAGSTVEVELSQPEASALLLRSTTPVTGALRLEVPPLDEEPLAREGATTSAGPETRATETTEATADSPAGTTATTDGVTATTDSANATTDGATATTDSATATTAPDLTSAAEPLVHPAGESAWTAATEPASTPLALALPDLGAVPHGGARLVISAVDGTAAEVVWLVGDTVRHERVELADDTSRTLQVPRGARAVWVRAEGEQGVVAAVHVLGEDRTGPYLAAAGLPRAPWLSQVPTVRHARP